MHISKATSRNGANNRIRDSILNKLGTLSLLESSSAMHNLQNSPSNTVQFEQSYN
jgi:hypothetical protein